MTEQQRPSHRFKKDTAYYEAHQQELLVQYPEQWVAIFDQQVVGANPDLRHLLAEITAKGTPPGRALLEYIGRRG